MLATFEGIKARVPFERVEPECHLRDRNKITHTNLLVFSAGNGVGFRLK